MTSPDRPDFSNVQGSVDSTEAAGAKADFSNVQSSVTSTERTSSGGHRSYIVVHGDTLSHIAKHFYGKASHWHAIFAANRDQLDDPDRIRPGQVLIIPDEQT